MADLTDYFQEQSSYVVQYLVVTLGKLPYAYFYSGIRRFQADNKIGEEHLVSTIRTCTSSSATLSI